MLARTYDDGAKRLDEIATSLRRLGFDGTTTLHDVAELREEIRNTRASL